MNHAIILAAGKGTRMQEKTNKILLSLLGKPVIYYPLKAFEDCRHIGDIILSANKNELLEIEYAIKEYGFKKIKRIIAGGEQRQNSFF